MVNCVSVWLSVQLCKSVRVYVCVNKMCSIFFAHFLLVVALRQTIFHLTTVFFTEIAIQSCGGNAAPLHHRQLECVFLLHCCIHLSPQMFALASILFNSNTLHIYIHIICATAFNCVCVCVHFCIFVIAAGAVASATAVGASYLTLLCSGGQLPLAKLFAAVNLRLFVATLQLLEACANACGGTYT